MSYTTNLVLTSSAAGVTVAPPNGTTGVPANGIIVVDVVVPNGATRELKLDLSLITQLKAVSIESSQDVQLSYGSPTNNIQLVAGKAYHANSTDQTVDNAATVFAPATGANPITLTNSSGSDLTLKMIIYADLIAS